LGSSFNEIAVQRELADQRIDLAQAQRQLRVVFQIAAHEFVFASASFQSHRTGVVGGSDAVLLRQREHAQNLAHGDLSVVAMKGLTQLADVSPGFFRSREQLLRRKRSAAGAIFVFDPMPAAFLPQVLAQQLPGERIDQPNMGYHGRGASAARACYDFLQALSAPP